MYGGRDLRLRCWGAGDDAARTAVFLHHGLGAIESWKALPALLAAAVPGLHCVAYERWGYGKSEARQSFEPGFMEAEVPTLLEMLDELTPQPVDLVGHSDGATIALLAASQHEDRVRSVVSIAAHTFVETVTTTSIRALLDEAERHGVQGWLSRFHGTRGLQLLRAWADVWLGQVHRGWDIRAALSSIRCPVLAIQGDADEFGSDEQLWSIGRAVRRAETWHVRGVGHTPFVDEPAFAQRIVEFWSSV